MGATLRNLPALAYSRRVGDVRYKHRLVAGCADDQFEVVDLRGLASVPLDRAEQEAVKRLAIARIGPRPKRGDTDPKPTNLKFERLWPARLAVGV
ncbi:hypothetical protein ACFPJ1_11880 [Kribbella qitaiheensis]|uniref:hypothetical protein n=1 Tax=Kribbella qitaiheensis TaxID=1544730 RepID=UPI00361437E6